MDEPDAVHDVHDLPGGARAALEAVLMVADEPIPAVRLAAALGLPTGEVDDLLVSLAEEYRGEHGFAPRGFELREAGGGWRVYSAPAFAEVVGRFVLEGQTARLTQAALETLAVIAYRQPVTRGQVSAVRGVNVDGVVRTLSTRGLVAEVGQDPSTGAVLYGTTGYFLERMGFTSLDELPHLAPHLPDMETLDGLDAFGGLGPRHEPAGRDDHHDHADGAGTSTDVSTDTSTAGRTAPTTEGRS
ncbi:SMC-Scp complex subunit ScpB [Oerskovia flava]|uniref:SMC-Scp complex subunit ScpB n=1 Tax=Oerskovia flava TaxID=2986422 RepID=UPI00223F7DBE|nr:SMC-Scp complex subunit ScpB [Oerskovia sp. JB1-3-2]